MSTDLLPSTLLIQLQLIQLLQMHSETVNVADDLHAYGTCAEDLRVLEGIAVFKNDGQTGHTMQSAVMSCWMCIFCLIESESN